LAWTTPKTWSAGETLTAANFNTHIRDNLNAVGPIQKVLKTADETVTSSNVAQDDNHLFFSIGANETWGFSLSLLTNNGNTSNSIVRGKWAVPAGATGSWAGGFGSSGLRIPTAVGLTTTQDWAYITSSNIWGSGEGYVATAGTAGTFQFQWAQVVSDPVGSIVRLGSWLYAVRLA
jgi:hypothetical protein